MGLVLTYFLCKLRAKPTRNEDTFKLEGDQHQRESEVLEKGWIDDWLLFCHSPAGMQELLRLWEEVLQDLGWALHPDKTELVAVTCAPLPITFK